MTNKVTVSAIRGNAGAGGVMAALAADYVWTHRNVILNPHYKSMGLFGSEYWTHFLPERVGSPMAAYLTESMQVRARPCRAAWCGEVWCSVEHVGPRVPREPTSSECCSSHKGGGSCSLLFRVT